MQLPESIRKHLYGEFRFAVDKMAETPDLVGKLYFFSALFGEANRAMNQHWDAELGLIHFVLSKAHADMLVRFSQPPLGLGPMAWPQELPEALTKAARELTELFEGSEQDAAKIHQVLARIAEIAYTVSGNGYYLYLKGAIKV
jgi:hypothetical protein